MHQIALAGQSMVVNVWETLKICKISVEKDIYVCSFDFDTRLKKPRILPLLSIFSEDMDGGEGSGSSFGELSFDDS